MIIKNYRDARHLCVRMGLGAEHSLIKDWVEQDLEQVIKQLMQPPLPSEIPDLLSVREFYRLRKQSRSTLTPGNKKAFRSLLNKDKKALNHWWINQLIHTSSPLTERMTLFWHNHFTSSIRKVRSAALMYQQNAMLRQYALGNFADLLRDITRDPAMLLYLDNAKSKQSSPNENFARELLELFTLGEGRFSEEDVTAATRAFTGFGVDRNQGTFRFRKKHHDSREKTFLGKTGKLDGDQIIDHLLLGSRLAEFISEKFWREFINLDTPNPNTIRTWSVAFRNSGYEIKTLLGEVIKSREFWDEANRGALIKSPIELTLGLLREGISAHYSSRQANQLWRLNKQMGQTLFEPPNVKGWPGGTHWIAHSTLLKRYKAVGRLTRERKKPSSQPMSRNPASMKSLIARTEWPEPKNAHSLEHWLLPIPPIQPDEADKKRSVYKRIRHLINDPAYQLK